MSKDDLVSSAVNELGLPDDFFVKLPNEDDWSFIIKLSSLFEAVCTQLLVKALDKDGIDDVLSNLEIGNQKYGKLIFLRSLDVIDDTDEQFIRRLSEIRNAFVHDISRLSSTVKNYLQEIKSDKKKDTCIQQLSAYQRKSYIVDGIRKTREELLANYPVPSIWVSANYCLEKLLLKKQEMHLDKLWETANVKNIRVDNKEL